MSFHAALHYLREVAFRLEIAGDHFRQTAYSQAASALEASGCLDGWHKLPGIGKSIRSELELVLTGQTPQRLLDLQLAGPPASVMGMLAVSGIGTKRALSLYQSGVSGLPELLEAVREHRISDPALVHAVYAYKAAAGAVPHAVAAPVVDAILQILQALFVVSSAQPVGAYRRQKPDIRDVELLVAVKDLRLVRKITDVVARHIGSKVEVGNGTAGENRTRVTGVTATGQRIPVVLTFCAPADFGSGAALLTGPRSFTDMCRARAADIGVTFEACHISRGGAPVPCTCETDFFDVLGIPFVAPEHREHLADLMHPPSLLSASDIVGDMHVHSNAGVGLVSVSDAQAHGRDLGYKVVGVCDHFRSFGRGVHGDGVAKYKQAISTCAKAGPVPAVIGAKLELRLDGSFEPTAADLAGVRYVLLEINADPERVPLQRYEAAIKAVRAMLPSVAVAVTHPGNRRIGERGFVNMDWSGLYRLCSMHNTAIDVSGDPYRADPGDEALTLGAKYKVKFLLGSEARTATAMTTNINTALAQANRALLGKSDILNMSVPALKHWLAGSDLRRLG